MAPIPARSSPRLRAFALGVAVALGALALPPATLAQSPSAAERARAWVAAHLDALGLAPADVDGMTLSSSSRSPASGVDHVYFHQRHAGLEVARALLDVHLLPSGETLRLGNRFVADLAARVDATEPRLAPDDAVGRAAAGLGLTLAAPLGVVAVPGGVERATLLSDGGISRAPIPVRLVYQPLADGRVALAWELAIETLDTRHLWSVRVGALDGAILDLADRVLSESFEAHPEAGAAAARSLAARGTRSSTPLSPPSSLTAGGGGASYEAFALPSEYPADGPRVVVVDPHDPAASPFGWHDTNGAPGAEFTSTRGNNVDAYADRDGDNTADPGSRPDGGAGLDFTGALVPYDETLQPDQYLAAAVVNLFYWSNVLHDVLHRYGFDEAAGNFQVNNYGVGGLGGDPVRAEAQDNAAGGARNNANFATPADGQPPRMQMYLWNEPTPERDGDLSSLIVAHEYSHGLSTRLVGGPANVACLDNREQMGEGWSDFVGLALTAKATDQPTTWRAVAAWAKGEDPVTGAGIRPAVYTTDLAVNGYTYGDLPSLSVPHGVGFVFASTLWDLYWLLVEDHGFDPDVYAGWTSGGNNLALQLAIEGMKLAPCGPGFVDARDALLDADLALTGGANRCRIWEAFARRGLGASAQQNDPDDEDDGVEAFDLPATCDRVHVAAPPLGQAICAGAPAVYTIDVGAGFTNGPVTLAASGYPPGASVAFAPNPVSPVPGSSTMTVSATAGAAPGSYAIAVAGSDGVIAGFDFAPLTLVDAPPAPPTLLAPLDGAAEVARRPLLSWSASPEVAAVVVEVDDDPTFGSVDRSATITPPFTSWRVDPPLASETFYWWRARAANACGEGADAAPRSFLTEVALCSAPGVAIPDDDPAGVSDAVAVALLGSADDLDVELHATHTAVGDLVLRLRHEETGTTIRLADRPLQADGYFCLGRDADVTFDDAGLGAVETSCDGTAPALDGVLRPEEALAAFAGEALAGSWTLTVADESFGNDGTLDEWCLLPRGAGAGAALVATKVVGGTFTPGSGVRYTVTLTNLGPGAQADGPGNELSDALPAALEVFAADASAGAVIFDPIAGTVAWNGALAAGESVTIRFDARLADDALTGTEVANQALFVFDSNGNGTNESSGASDDPATPEANDPTRFVVVAPIPLQEIPTLSELGLAALALALAALALATLRRRAPGARGGGSTRSF